MKFIKYLLLCFVMISSLKANDTLLLTNNFNLGFFGGYDLGLHNANFKYFNECPTCNPHYFGNNTGSGFAAGFLLGIPLFGITEFEIRPSISIFDVTNVSHELNVPFNQNGNVVYGAIDYNLIAKFMALSTDLIIANRIVDNLELNLGANLNYLLKGKFDQQEIITSPSGITFSDTKTNIRNVRTDDTIPQLNKLQVKILFGLSYNLYLNSNKSIALTPEIFYNFPINSISKSVDWKKSSLFVDLALKINFNSPKSPKKCDDDQDSCDGKCLPKCKKNQIRDYNCNCRTICTDPNSESDNQGGCKCKDGYELDKQGNCIVKCGPNQIRDINGVCIDIVQTKTVEQPPSVPCPKPNTMLDVNGNCVCKDGFELDKQGNCIVKCGPNQTRDVNGVCIDIVQIKKVDPPPPPPAITCNKPNTVLDANGKCVCKEGFELDKSGNCVQKCGPNQTRDINGVCIDIVKEKPVVPQPPIQKATCTKPNTVLDSSGNCVCKDGYMKDNLDNCVLKCTDPNGVSDGKGGCNCNPGYEKDQSGKCLKICGKNSILNINNDCECYKGFHKDDKGNCVKDCGRFEVNDPYGECECQKGYFKDITGACVKDCPDYKHIFNNITGECDCIKGYIKVITGECYDDCKANAKFNMRTGECECKDGYSQNENGDCVQFELNTTEPKTNQALKDIPKFEIKAKPTLLDELELPKSKGKNELQSLIFCKDTNSIYFASKFNNYTDNNDVNSDQTSQEIKNNLGIFKFAGELPPTNSLILWKPVKDKKSEEDQNEKIAFFKGNKKGDLFLVGLFKDKILLENDSTVLECPYEQPSSGKGKKSKVKVDEELNPDKEDVFIINYDKQGKRQYAKGLGGNQKTDGKIEIDDIDYDQNDNLFILGSSDAKKVIFFDKHKDANTSSDSIYTNYPESKSSKQGKKSKSKRDDLSESGLKMKSRESMSFMIKVSKNGDLDSRNAIVIPAKTSYEENGSEFNLESHPEKISINNRNNIYISGFFNRFIHFQEDMIGKNDTLKSIMTDLNGSNYLFTYKLQKYNDSIRYVWGQAFGGNTKGNKLNSMITDNYGNSYILFNTNSKLAYYSNGSEENDITPIALRNENKNETNSVFYLMKIDSTGKRQWVYTLFTNNDNTSEEYSKVTPLKLYLDVEGNPQIFGNIKNKMNLIDFDIDNYIGPSYKAKRSYYDSLITSNTVTTGAKSKEDVFILKIDRLTGKKIWIEQIGSTNKNNENIPYSVNGLDVLVKSWNEQIIGIVTDDPKLELNNINLIDSKNGTNKPIFLKLKVR